MGSLALALLAALPVLARGEIPAKQAAAASPPSAPAPAAAAPEWEDVPSPEDTPAAVPGPPQSAPAQAEVPPPVPPYAAPPPRVAAPPPYAPPQAPPPRAPPAPAQAGPPAKQRGSWYIGFGLGAGGATFSFDGGPSAGMKEMVVGGGAPYAFNFRVGGTLTPKLLLGFDGGFLACDGDADSSIQLDTYDVGLMFFPQERGLYLRGAIGASEVEQQGSGFASGSASGWNVAGGIGYAFWLGKSFNLTLNLDVQRHWFDRSNLTGATAWSGWLGFDWY